MQLSNSFNVLLHWTQKRLKATRSNQNLTSNTTCERFQPVTNFASDCFTLLKKIVFKWLAYFEKLPKRPKARVANLRFGSSETHP